MELDPIRVQVLDHTGTPLAGINGLVTIGGQEAYISESEYWGTHQFTKYDEKINITASYTMPDGSVVSGQKEFSASEFDNWFSPSMRDPLVIQLPIIPLAIDETQDVGMVHCQDSHVRTPAGPSLFDLFCRCIENLHE